MENCQANTRLFNSDLPDLSLKLFPWNDFLADLNIFTNAITPFDFLQDDPDGGQKGDNQGIDPDLYDSDGNYDPMTAHIKTMKSFQLRVKSLRCPALDDNPIFCRLRARLIKFFIE